LAWKSLQSKRVFLFVAAGLAAFILYLYYYVGTGNFVEVVKQANIYYYASAFVAFIIAGVFSALTWRSLLGNLHVKTGVRHILLLTWVGYFFDATLPEPGWSGDISKAYMLSKKSDAEVGKTVASVVSQKIIGMAVTVVILVLGFGLLAFNVELPQEVIVFFGVVIAIAVGSFVVVYWMSRNPKVTCTMLNRLLIPILSFFLRRRFNETQFRAEAEKFLAMFHEGICTSVAEKKMLALPVGLYALSVTFDVSVVFFVFASLGHPIPVYQVLMVYALTGTLASVGVSFVGVTEIITSTAYQVLSIPLALSFSVTLLTRIVTLWFKLVLGYVSFQWAGVGILLGKKQPAPAAHGEP
jgi:uncharacterized protein (TIRG00374 family)